MKTSKPVLIKWSSEFSKEIDNLKYLYLDEIIEKNNLMREKRIEMLSILLNNALEEIKSRDLINVKTGDLLKIIMVLDKKLKSEFEEIKYNTGEVESWDWQLDKEEKILSLLY
ncbi:MAG: hypothetical protein L0Y79_00335 [Chlorobi bacterium]|nr:hypothetical protein [Chlorobiota bacterium]MCI0716924.1 hypothetical protein [Chlorobiota bacterium]